MKEYGVDCVAVEATGVYWINFFDLCEEADLEVWLVNPKYTQSRAGKKTDVADAIWIQNLHSADLLEKSFIPAKKIRAYREYVRTRETYLEQRASAINRMVKSLIQMNLRIDNVISQIHGVSGMKMIKHIISGERDSDVLISLCDKRIQKNKTEELREALEGNFQEQYIFNLEHALEDYHYFDKKLKFCDKKIEAVLNELIKGLVPLEKVNKPKPIRHNKPEIAELQLYMQTLNGGIDLTKMPGFTNYSLMKITSELGFGVEAWPTKKHFTSYLGLAPGQNRSGSIHKKAKKSKNKHRASIVFRQMAQSVINSKDQGIGAFGRRLKSRKGPRIAIKATARKLAELYYTLLTQGADYVEKGISTYEQQMKERRTRSLEKQAKKLGFTLSVA